MSKFRYIEIFKYFGFIFLGMVIKIGSLVKFYTILLLNEGPKHGYELMKSLKEKLGKGISPSQVYPFLNILEKNIIIKVGKKSIRDKKVFSLTLKGKDFVKGHLERFGDLLHMAIEPKLSTCAHCGCKVYSGGHKVKVGKKELTFCCHYCAKACK